MSKIEIFCYQGFKIYSNGCTRCLKVIEKGDICTECIEDMKRRSSTTFLLKAYKESNDG